MRDFCVSLLIPLKPTRFPTGAARPQILKALCASVVLPKPESCEKILINAPCASAVASKPSTGEASDTPIINCADSIPL